MASKRSGSPTHTPTTSKMGKLSIQIRELRRNLGISHFNTSYGPKQTPAQWIKKELTGHVKKQTIYNNIRFCLGNDRAVESKIQHEDEEDDSIENAIELVCKRDYPFMGDATKSYQIFVPEEKISSIKLLKQFVNISDEDIVKHLRGLSLSEKNEKLKINQQKANRGELVEQGLYDALKVYFKLHGDQQVLVIYQYHFAKKVREAKANEKDFIIINRTLGYIMCIEAKSKLKQANVEKATKQLVDTRELFEAWFGRTSLLSHFKYISVLYTSNPSNLDFLVERHARENKFWICGPDEVKVKMDRIHCGLPASSSITLEEFEELAKNLLFFTTVQQVPIRSNFDIQVRKSFDGIEATDVDFWNMTPTQRSIMQSEEKCFLFTSEFSTGKTMLLQAKAREVAETVEGSEVLFIVCSRNLDCPVLLRAKLEIGFHGLDNLSVKSIRALMDEQYHSLSHFLLKFIDIDTTKKSIFVDELILEEDTRFHEFEKVAKKLRANNQCFWLAVSRVTSLGRPSGWIDSQSTFLTPSLSYCMRNSKDIFHESKTAKYDFNSGKNSPVSSIAELPQNIPQGRVKEIIHQSNRNLDRKTIWNSGVEEDMFDTFKQAFDYAQTVGGVIIVFNYIGVNMARRFSSIIKRIRGKEPIELLWHSMPLSNSKEDAMVQECKAWLLQHAKRPDLITQESFLCGFEWPCIIWVGEIGQTPTKDLIMRTVSTFVKILLPQGTLHCESLQ